MTYVGQRPKRAFVARPLDVEILDLLARCAVPPRSTGIAAALPSRSKRETRNAINRMRRYGILDTARGYNWKLTELGWHALKELTPARCAHCKRPYERAP
jgi:hypothetical protein